MDDELPSLKRSLESSSDSDDESFSQRGMDMDDENRHQAIGRPDDDPDVDQAQPKPPGLKRRRLFVEPPSDDELSESGTARWASPLTHSARVLR